MDSIILCQKGLYGWKQESLADERQYIHTSLVLKSIDFELLVLAVYDIANLSNL